MSELQYLKPGDEVAIKLRGIAYKDGRIEKIAKATASRITTESGEVFLIDTGLKLGASRAYNPEYFTTSPEVIRSVKRQLKITEIHELVAADATFTAISDDRLDTILSLLSSCPR